MVLVIRAACMLLYDHRACVACVPAARIYGLDSILYFITITEPLHLKHNTNDLNHYSYKRLHIMSHLKLVEPEEHSTNLILIGTTFKEQLSINY